MNPPGVDWCNLPHRRQVDTHLERTNPWKVFTGAWKRNSDFARVILPPEQWRRFEQKSINARSPPTLGAALPPTHTFGDTEEDDHLHSLWLKRLITSLVCVLYARLKMACHWLAATSFSLPNTKPCSLLAASGCMSNCPCVGQGVSVSKEPLSGFCEVLFLHPSPWGSMTLCYVSGRNQKLEQSEDVVFCFKRRAIIAHCQKPATLLPSFPTPVCSPQLGCQ